MNLLTPTLEFDALGECDLVIEAVHENMEVKKEIFARLDEIAKPGAILASNTSYLSIDEIASATNRPGDVLGLHFFSPANRHETGRSGTRRQNRGRCTCHRDEYRPHDRRRCRSSPAFAMALSATAC